MSSGSTPSKILSPAGVKGFTQDAFDQYLADNNGCLPPGALYEIYDGPNAGTWQAPILDGDDPKCFATKDMIPVAATPPPAPDGTTIIVNGDGELEVQFPTSATNTDLDQQSGNAEPTTRSDGSALVIGDQWQDPATGLNYWNGTAWVSVSGFMTATAADAPGPDALGNPIAVADNLIELADGSVINLDALGGGASGGAANTDLSGSAIVTGHTVDLSNMAAGDAITVKAWRNVTTTAMAATIASTGTPTASSTASTYSGAPIYQEFTFFKHDPDTRMSFSGWTTTTTGIPGFQQGSIDGSYDSIAFTNADRIQVINHEGMIA